VGLSLLLLLVVSCKGSEAPTSSTPVGETRSSETSISIAAVRQIEPSLLMELFASLRAGDRALPAQIAALLTSEPEKAQKDPNWPTLVYLVGEVHRQRGETEKARGAFRELASWAVFNAPAGPYNDTWGGSGLAIFGLWRWLQILEEYGASHSAEIDQVLQVASKLQDTRLYAGMVQAGLLPAMPLLEEDVARRLAHVAWKHQRPEATALFLDFLTIDSRGQPDKIDAEIMHQLLTGGRADPNRLDLFRAMRLLSLVKTKEQPVRDLKRLWENQQVPADVRAEAGYEWAYHTRMNKDYRQEILAVLTEVLKLSGDQPLTEKALYFRGTVYNYDQPRAMKKPQAFHADMVELLRRFPQSRLADEALFQLATEYLFEPDLERALPYYEQLRQFQGSNDYQDSAYYLPALGLLGRGREGDFDAADQLLDAYVQRYPDGVFRLRCLFWRGRIAEHKNNAKAAQDFFKKVIAEAPYDYYALRARMHLEEGRKAIKQDLPDANSKTRHELSEAYRKSQADTQLVWSSPYHTRLRVAGEIGLYRQLLDIDGAHTKRLDDISLAQLDAAGLTPAVALFLALRQDALAAKDAHPTADNWLRLAGFLGHQVQDWPLAIEMTFVRSRVPQKLLTELQNDPRYLATVYPQPADLKTLPMAQLLARAAWPIDGSRNLSQSLMYAVMRNESRFYPGAISKAGAIGLFQFMPQTFTRLDKGSDSRPPWNLLQESGVKSPVEYLLDPERNTRLWARGWSTSSISTIGMVSP
jgi:tetratricopeptide (TPR) repeat protein